MVTVGEIVRQVKEYLNEVPSVNSASVLNGSVPITERIRAIIPECAVFLMDGKDMPDRVKNSLAVDPDGMGTMEVPEDFGKLHELRLSCWKRSVFGTIGIGSGVYARQQNIVTRGGVCRPVVALVPYGNKRRLELYSIPVWDSRATVERATYVPVPDVSDDGNDIEMDEAKKALLCYMIAVRVARTYGQEDAVKLLNASLEEEQQKIIMTQIHG